MMAKKDSGKHDTKQGATQNHSHEHSAECSHEGHGAHDHSAHEHKTHSAHHTTHSKKDGFAVSAYHVVAVLVIVALGLALWAALQPKDPVVATVNGEPIYLSNIDKEWNQLPAEFKEGRTKRVMLNASIAEALVLQEAKRGGIIVSDAEVEQFIIDSIAGTGVPLEEFVKRAKELGIEEPDLKEMFRARLTTNKLFEKVLADDVEVNESAAKAFYQANKAMFTTGARVRASHILVEKEAQAKDILKELEGGANFSDLAKQYSKDTGSAVQGGDLGYFTKGRMVPEFEQAAFNLSKGAVSAPVQSQFGWHIIKVTDKKAAGVASYEEAKGDILLALRKERAELVIAKYMIYLESKAQIEITWDEKYEE